MKVNHFYRKSTVGLDIQAQVVRFVQLQKKRSTQHVQCLFELTLPPSIFVAGKVHDWQHLGSLIRHAVAANKLTGMKAVMALPISLVHILRLTVPRGLTQAAIEGTIRTQVKRELSGMQENLCIDYRELSTRHDTHTDLIAAVTRQDDVQHYLYCLKSSGLQVNIIDIDIYALCRIYQLGITQPTKTNAIYLLLDHHAYLLIFSEQEIIYQQRWLVDAEATLAHDLQERLRMFFLLHPNATVTQLLHNITTQTIELAELECEYFNPFATPHFQHSNTIPMSFLLAAACALREDASW